MPAHVHAPLLIALLAGGAAAQPCLWEHVPTPPVAGNFATIFDMDASAPDDIWVVGEYTSGALPWDYWNYAIHYDGERWTEISPPSLDPFGYHNGLTGVVAISPTEAYAGGTTKAGGAQDVVIFRWDGAAWELEDRPIPDVAASLGDVGRAGDELWAVGERWNTGHIPPETSNRPLALRRTASGDWEEVYVPPPAALGRSGNFINAIHGVSADDAWAVGDHNQTYTPGPSWGFTMWAAHWDGSEWTLDTTMPRTEFTVLDDVVMIATDDVWAVGYATGTGEGNQPLIMHYDGAAWERTSLPLYPGRGAILRSVVARAADDVYAVGVIDNYPGDDVALILHYDGTGWTEIPPPATDGCSEKLRSAVIAGPRETGELWAAGFYVKDGRPFTIRQNCDGCRADLTGDGSLDFFDFLEFQNLFAAGDLQADFTGDGALDFFDFLAFQNEIAAGCP
ncbi:MAG: GC-type dockerin domain-anchored protein [Phycisphaerales bacterium JB039]